MRAALVALCLVLSSCSRYSDFTLPVLKPAPGGVSLSWDVRPAPVIPSQKGFTDILNPAVTVLNGKFYNFYSAYDGKTWHTGMAQSDDAVTWMVKGTVLSPDPSAWEGDYIAANGTVLRSATEFLYWYQGGREPQIGLAVSPDGIRWKKRGAPVLESGPRGSWDERGAADPYAIRAGGYLYLYYLGQDRAQRQRLGVARSKDGIVWEKLRSNPVLDLGETGAFDELGLGEPAVWQQESSYWMLYTGRDRNENRRLGLARSQDGIHWSRVSDQPVLAGDQPWDSKVVCDPSVIVIDSGVRVWFGGGDRAEPAQGLHGQIGYTFLRLRTGAQATPKP